MMKKIFSLFFLFTLGSVIAATSDKPILRVGLLSDTHVTKNIASCSKVKAAWQIFKKANCDLVVNLGDIAEVYNQQAYRHYRNTVNSLFAPGEKKPRELYVYANHDRIGFSDIAKAFAAVKRDLECPNAPYDTLILKGYPFLVFPQFLDFQRYEKTIAEAIKKFPGKPIFVLDHIPPYNTVSHSKTWGNLDRRKILDKFPQVIHLAGHVHGSTFNERHIWQDKFTVVNAGSTLSGTVLIMEVFKSKLLFRRYSLIDGKEYCTDKVWNIPLPFDPSAAPYRLEHRKAKSSVPVFPAGAKLAVVPAENISEYVILEIPAAAPEVHYYMVTIKKKNAKNKWVLVATRKVNSAFPLRPIDRPPVLKRYFSEGYFESHAEYHISVQPFNFYGKKGKSLEIFWKAPQKAKSEILFESRTPMKDLPFMTGLAGGEPLKREGDFYIHDVHYARLVLPDRVWKNIPENSRMRFTVDMHTIQKSDLYRQWTLVLRNPIPVVNANSRITTFSGESVNRYVINFRMTETDYKYYLLIREGEAGKIRFNYVKLEILEDKLNNKDVKK